MTRVSVVSPDSVLAEVLEDAGYEVESLHPDSLDVGHSVLVHQDHGTWPDVVVVDGTVDATSALAVARNVASTNLSVVLVAKHESDLLLEALRAGVREVVEPDVPEGELSAAVSRVAVAVTHGGAEDDARSSVPRTGKAIVVVSAKGGVGKSTIAANLSMALARLAPQRVVLVDLDAQFGDAASLLDLEPEHSVLDAAESMAQADTVLLKTFLTPHPRGLLVLAGSPSPTAADRIKTEHARDVVTALKSIFDIVVVDTSAGITDQTVGALEAADEIVLVTTRDLSSVRAVAKELELLGRLGLPALPIRVVLNGQERKSGLLLKDLEQIIDRPVDVVLPRSDEALLAGNRGVPLILGKADSWVKAFRRLVDPYVGELAPSETVETRAPGGRRKGRKR